MKSIIKISTIITLFFMIFQSCISDESIKEIIVDEQSISNDLSEKIIATANYLNDYIFFVNNANNCGFLPTLCYFNNPEGDYYKFLINVESLDSWLSEYTDAKLQAFNTTGVEFTDEDFILATIGSSISFNFTIETREDYLQYFENCDFNFGSLAELGLPFSEANTNCNNDNGSEIGLYLDGESITVNTLQNLASINEFLDSINTKNNENYTTDDIEIIYVIYNAPNGEQEYLSKTKDLVNYFNDCLFNRDIVDYNCLNFVYPLDINRFSLQLEEVITTTIENNENLIAEFNTEVGELSFVYPISLLGQDDSILTIETNEALENALNNSSTYCN